MSRDTHKDFHLIRKVKQLLTETGMVGKSYFNHRKRKVSKISAGGRLRKNNQVLSYLRPNTSRTLKMWNLRPIPQFLSSFIWTTDIIPSVPSHPFFFYFDS